MVALRELELRCSAPAFDQTFGTSVPSVASCVGRCGLSICRRLLQSGMQGLSTRLRILRVKARCLRCCFAQGSDVGDRQRRLGKLCLQGD